MLQKENLTIMNFISQTCNFLCNYHHWAVKWRWNKGFKKGTTVSKLRIQLLLSKVSPPKACEVHCTVWYSGCRFRLWIPQRWGINSSIFGVQKQNKNGENQKRPPKVGCTWTKSSHRNWMLNWHIPAKGPFSSPNRHYLVKNHLNSS